jgi:hypothetical protein
MPDQPDPPKTDPPDHAGLYAPEKHYTRDIPADEDGQENAPVVKGSEPGGAKPDAD